VLLRPRRLDHRPKLAVEQHLRPSLTTVADMIQPTEVGRSLHHSSSLQIRSRLRALGLEVTRQPGLKGVIGPVDPRAQVRVMDSGL
jgi:hypothetical protein